MSADPAESAPGAGDGRSPPATMPSQEIFASVVGQPRAVAHLSAAARRPVHAYLLHGPPGSGKRAAARALAAALLCPRGGCGECNVCRRALAGTHPDLVTVERSGAALDVDEARSIVARAQRHPLEADRQVMVITDLQLAERAVPALLKTVEEPPPATVFVLIADALPTILATIASRCVSIAFDPVPEDAIVTWLTGRGVSHDQAESVARASGGRLDRAELLVTDPGYRARQEQWRSVPARLDGTGAAAAVVAAELLASADEALEPVRAKHAEELATLAEQAELTGSRTIAGRRQIEERHKREERRWRTDDLRFGLATLAEVYRDRLSDAVTGGAGPSPGSDADSRRSARHVQAITEASVALGRNANESLMMEALLIELSGMTD